MSNIIDQQRIGYGVSKEGDQLFQSYDPAKSSKIGPDFADATPSEVNRACALASQAFETYRKTSGKDKAAFLDAIADEIENVKETLVEVANAESALGLPRLNGECGRTTGQLRFFAKILREGSWRRPIIDCATAEQSGSQGDIRQIQIPLGPVAVFGASNFPLAFSTAGGDTASALAAGCPVVFKAHPAHPQTSALVAEAILKAAQKLNMPEGVFSMVYGNAHQVGGTLVENPHITAVGFTGSYRGGKALFELANRREVPIPVYAEMGSVNPIFFLPNAIAKNSAEMAKNFAGSINLGVGQFCTNPGVFVTFKSAESTEFVNQLVEVLEAQPEGVMLTEGIAKAYCSGVKSLENVAGVEKLLSVDYSESIRVKPGLFQVDLATLKANPSVLTEVFGPTTLHISIEESELPELLSLLEGQITATIFAEEGDEATAASLAEKLEQLAGRTIFNGFPTGVAVNYSMVHGGPYPATTQPGTTSVGGTAILRFTRPVAYQAYPEALLPDELKNENVLGVWRLLNGEWSKNNL
ncbi:aldehyde dehydrogenase (NADP(+)) [Membranihabitans marinus]|uniref:aldehyde dehydrogenase (NADP(+)) n=1 Tax=Membranihabitans marinus TaxID=1227546 RepID=UPI001F3FA31D|nr:aldehyde dehydrogenase (NADP(+)) [Membranihabitans marinus]